MRRHAVGLLLALGVGLSAHPAAAQRDPAEVRVETLANDLIVLRSGPGGNVLASIGPDGVVLIDAQSAYQADSIVGALSAWGAQSVRLVLNTHYHEDHIGGNRLLRSRGAVTVAHRGVRPRALVDTTITELQWHREPADSMALPMVEVGHESSLRINGHTVDVLAFNDAHTDADLAFRFREHNVVHTGDIVEVGAYPFVDWWGGGTLDGTISAVDRLLSMADETTRFVPGHGPVVRPDDVREYRRMLVEVRERVRARIAAGASLDEVMDAGLTTEFDESRGGERAGRRFAGILYLGLSTVGR